MANVRAHRKPDGFTLVELLVVIGIIAVLIGILIPVLGKARRTANNVKCRANLTQVGQALRMYANDYADRFPDGYTLGGAVYRVGLAEMTPTWIDPFRKPERYGMTAILHGVESDKDDLSNGMPLKYRYLPGRSEVWMCPSQTEERKEFRNTYVNIMAQPGTVIARYTSLKRGRAKEVFWVYDNFSNLPFVSGARARGSEGTRVLPEAQWFFPHDYSVKAVKVKDGNRAQGSINILFLDGHVGSAVYRYRSGPNGPVITSEIVTGG